MKDKAQQIVDKKLKRDMAAVKALADSIGYGHLMELTSALWRYELKKEGICDDGVLLPTTSSSIKEEELSHVLSSNVIYDKLIKKYNK